jgi:phage replication initiation protein
MADSFELQGLPSSNRGVNSFRLDTQTWLGIDWCAFTIDLPLFFDIVQPENRTDLLEFVDIPDFAQHSIKLVKQFFLDTDDIVLSQDVKNGRFYKNRIQLDTKTGEYIGLIEIGGTTARANGSQTARIELTGLGCQLFEQSNQAGSDHAKRWLELKAKLESVDGRLTRVDVAYDDFKGLNTYQSAVQMWKDGIFNQHGQKASIEDRYDHGSGNGSTVYIGSSTSEKILCVYEKGKQLKDKESPWVRWEVRFKASSRKPISLDILRDPAAYYRGAYPAFTFIQACMLRFEASQIKDVACMKSVLRHAKRMYGKTFNFLCHYYQDDKKLGQFIQNLSRPTLPDWGYQILQGGTSIEYLDQA